MKKLCSMFILVILFAAFDVAHANNTIVIVNQGLGLTSVSRMELQQIFLGKVVNWSDGEKATPVTLKSGDVHNDFLKIYLGKSSSQFDTFWKQAIFTGTGRPPKSLGSEADIVKFVASTDGAVGYIDSATPHASVKVLEIN